LILAFFVGFLSLDVTPAYQQSVVPTPGFGSDRDRGSRDPYGHPCITDVKALAVPVSSSKTNLFEQAVTMTNTCFKKLRVRVCYRGSERCKIADLPSNEKTQIVLGYEPKESFFLFQYKEVPLSYVE
jgi:hypothetical protein